MWLSVYVDMHVCSNKYDSEKYINDSGDKTKQNKIKIISYTHLNTSTYQFTFKEIEFCIPLLPAIKHAVSPPAKNIQGMPITQF